MAVANDQFKSKEELISYCANKSLNEHPFFSNMDHYQLPYLWALLRVGLPYKGRESSWILQLCDRIDDQRLKSLLIADLDDDLGNGDHTKRHELVLQNMAASLAPWALKDKISLLDKGANRFATGIDKYRTHEDVRVALGGTITGYVFGQTMIEFMLKTLRSNASELKGIELNWFHPDGQVGETSSHKAESLEIASCCVITKNPGDLDHIVLGVKGTEKVYLETFDLLNSLTI